MSLLLFVLSNISPFVDTLGDPYHKRVTLPRIPEYRDISRDFQLLKPTVEIVGVEPNISSDYPNGYKRIFGRRRAQSTQSVQYHILCA